MKLDFQNERVMAVVAHPDDAELLCAGTLARAQHEGAAVGICVLCRGDKGQPQRRIVNLSALRRREAGAAARCLGAKLFFGSYADGTLADGIAQRRRLTEIFRRFRPSLVLAHAPEDYHPDHRAASAIAEAASWFCASHGQKTATAAMATAPALWFMDTLNMIGFLPGFLVDVSGYEPLKEQMLGCHRSQLVRGADADFSPLVDLMRQQLRTRGSQGGVAAAEAFRAYSGFKRTRAW